MLRSLALLSAIPTAAPARALFDGSSGTIGQGVVGAYELRDGAVALDKIADLSAGRILGRPTGAGSGAPQEMDAATLRALSDESAATVFFASIFDAEAASIPATPSTVVTFGYETAGDGGGGEYRRIGSNPSHQAKLQTADGQWWELSDQEPTPLQLGAKFDGSTDDTIAINNWVLFLRIKGRAGRLPAGSAYCSGTVYMGGVRVRGAGGVNNTDASVSKTLILSDANPMLSMGPRADQPDTFHLTHWEDFTVASAGGPVSPITLWDTASYPYQIGIWVGRNHNYMETVAGGETPTIGGAGGLTMRRVCVQDASGWGLYGYKLWGKSLIDDCFFRRCGGKGAFEMNDDRKAGVMNFAGVSVDFAVSNIHAFAGGYANSGMNHRGTGIRIGAYKSDTDALGRLWEPGGNQKFESIFTEGYNVPYDIRATSSVMLDNMSLSGDRIYFGAEENPANQCKITFSKWRTFNLEEINITQSATVDLGQLLKQDQGTDTVIKYWTGFTWTPPGGGVDPTGVYNNPTVLEPRFDLSAGASNSYRFLPLVATSYDPSSIWSNLLPPFSNSDGGNLQGWNRTGGGDLQVSNRWRVRIKNGAQVAYDVDALSPGDLVTVQLWFEVNGSPDQDDITYGVRNGSNALQFQRPLGLSGVPVDTNWRAFNARVPADGVLRVFVKNATGSNVFLRHPVVCAGASAPLGRHYLTAWPTPEGVIATA